MGNAYWLITNVWWLHKAQSTLQCGRLGQCIVSMDTDCLFVRPQQPTHILTTQNPLTSHNPLTWSPTSSFPRHFFPERLFLARFWLFGYKNICWIITSDAKTATMSPKSQKNLSEAKFRLLPPPLNLIANYSANPYPTRHQPTRPESHARSVCVALYLFWYV